ncbi:exosortase family protein XrtF [Tamlana sp. 2_MG-2023]|uniref:exosortase family protein XrtF n=1 Tax=Tamlana sp. 1_MG-2023 TaxID=3062628 RepID=UPI0026E1AB05|nr:exosortase family protein XrtF [Tamlana sp. 1_MG-2023]MDO6760763.1 exosortase family protein XrtF [Tamlana sp. 2_MG-2023]MDO6791019.1 exosortase family protein XrtF [Tamlana sp. 1_MG-2023]
MKALFIKYKSVIKFMLTFLGVYVALSVIYSFYLEFSDGSIYYPDYFTNLVGLQTSELLEFFGYQSEVLKHPNEPSLKLLLNGEYLARIVEGCNALSVIILFISFIIAFSGTFKITTIYILSGSVLIYIVNLLRIAVLAIGLYLFPEYEEVLHNVVFPGIIYGMVFLLWVIWVNRFSKLKKKHV